MSVFDHPEFDHEQIVFCRDDSVGLKAIIAVHSTALGPSAGGCRMFPYDSEGDALTDVLRLSRGMSFKSAVADVPLGGGKAVVIADPARADKAELLRAFSRFVQDLGGKYWTAIDIGTNPHDAEIMAENCDFVFTRASEYEAGFNPSVFTSLGGFTGMRAVAKHLWGREDLAGIRVAVQGLGQTGSGLCRLLHEAGAELVVADVNQAAVDDIVEQFGAVAAPPSEIFFQDVDIVAPCAMGAVLNDETIGKMTAKAVCGLANNQLAENRHGVALRDKGIIYVPDYVANSGGIIGVSTGIFGTYSRADSEERVRRLFDAISAILERAEKTGMPPSEVADLMAVEKIAGAGK